MKIRLYCVWLAALTLTPAHAQLYLVTGSQNHRSVTAAFSSEVVRLDEAGKLHTTAQITPGESGLWWLEMSFETRKLIAMTTAPDSSAVVVDMDKGTVGKRCKIPPGPGMQFMEWLADVPAKGLSLVLNYGSLDVALKDARQIMLIDPAVPCEASFEMIAPATPAEIVVNGRAGVADEATNRRAYQFLDADGRVFVGSRNGDRMYLGYQVPEVFRTGFSKLPAFDILVNNSKVLLAALASGEDHIYRLLAFRKRDQTWHEILTQGDYPQPRGFGSFLAIPESRKKGVDAPESAGKAEWGKEPSRRGPSRAELFKDSEFVYPGTLHIYDVDTERTYRIDTRQGDSEVLLIENGTIYYRVSNRLYSATIGSEKIGNPKLLATDELIGDAHWAFVRR